MKNYIRDIIILILIMLLTLCIAIVTNDKEKSKAQEIVNNKCYSCHEGDFKLDSVAGGFGKNIYNYKCNNCGFLYWTSYQLK